MKRCGLMGSPTKFPIPAGAMHVILIDMRGYLDGGGHKNAYRQIAYGGRDPIVNREWVPESWQGPSGKREPVNGLFEASNTRPAARLIQERIHFLGFINECKYREGEIRSPNPNIMHYLANPHIFSTEAEAEEAFASYLKCLSVLTAQGIRGPPPPRARLCQ
jgi:hypothetical protein